MSITQDRMLAVLDAAALWQRTAETLKRHVDAFTEVAVRLYEQPNVDWPSYLGEFFAQCRVDMPPVSAYQTLLDERAHFKAVGARNRREARRMAARRAGLPPQRRSTIAGKPSPRPWTCKRCDPTGRWPDLRNAAELTECATCGTPRNAEVSAPDEVSSAETEVFAETDIEIINSPDATLPPPAGDTLEFDL